MNPASTLFKWVIPLGLGVLGMAFPAIAYARQPTAVREVFGNPSDEVARVRDIRSAAEYLPWYDIPARFLFRGNFHTKLNMTSLRIDHVAVNSRCTRRNRTFMISASLDQPIGNRLFSGRFEIPILSADRFALSRLAPASVGDYVMHFSDRPLLSSALQLVISARF